MPMVDLQIPISDDAIRALHIGDQVRLYGTVVTARDAAHKYMSGGKLLRAEGSKAKYFATELAVKATRYAVQILGGAGYVDEHPVERWYRDAPLLTIFEGTTQVQVNLIASVGTGLRIR